MVKFKIDKKNFKNFLEKTACVGAIKFRDGKAVTQPFFSCFYIDVVGDRLEVLTIDTVKKKIQLNSIIKGIEVIEEGQLLISDYKAIVEVLGGKGLDDGLITVYDEGAKLHIEAGGDGYEIRQRENKDVEILQAKNQQKLKYLETWKKAHTFEEHESIIEGQPVKTEGILVINLIDPKTKETVSARYPTKIEISKSDIMKVVDDTVKLTKDNKTKLILKNGTFQAFKGEANARTKGKHEIPFDDLGEELIEFDEEFYNIQTIFPNLFDKITLNIRKVIANNTLAVMVKSVDEKSKTEMMLGLVSVIAGSKEEQEEEKEDKPKKKRSKKVEEKNDEEKNDEKD